MDVSGSMDAEGTSPMQPDTVFRLASMTKPVIEAAVMMMLEEGRLRLDDPISMYIPEFTGQRVAILEEPGSNGNPPAFHTATAERDITIKDLLARVVEIVSDMPLNLFLKQRIFDPLDMPDTSHYPTDLQMLANGGEFNGQRLLGPRTVDLMSSVHIPSSLPGRGVGEGCGLSVRVIDDAVAGDHRISDGSFGWSGAYGTHFWNASWGPLFDPLGFEQVLP